jgi:hypothetical protein
MSAETTHSEGRASLKWLQQAEKQRGHLFLLSMLSLGLILEETVFKVKENFWSHRRPSIRRWWLYNSRSCQKRHSQRVLLQGSRNFQSKSSMTLIASSGMRNRIESINSNYLMQLTHKSSIRDRVSLFLSEKLLGSSSRYTGFQIRILQPLSVISPHVQKTLFSSQTIHWMWSLLSTIDLRQRTQQELCNIVVKSLPTILSETARNILLLYLHPSSLSYLNRTWQLCSASDSKTLWLLLQPTCSLSPKLASTMTCKSNLILYTILRSWNQSRG